jgi:hypothetical protein
MFSCCNTESFILFSYKVEELDSENSQWVFSDEKKLNLKNESEE